MMKDIDIKYPGVIDSIVKRTPSGRLGEPEDLAYAYLYLASSIPFHQTIYIRTHGRNRIFSIYAQQVMH